jgi:hypothetical protein
MNINCTPLFSVSGNGVVEHRKYFKLINPIHSCMKQKKKSYNMFVIYSVINKIELGEDIMCDNYDERLVYIFFYFEHYILKKF